MSASPDALTDLIGRLSYNNIEENVAVDNVHVTAASVEEDVEQQQQQPTQTQHAATQSQPQQHAHQNDAAGRPNKPLTPRSRPELCRHWARGRCLAGDRCAFQHPADRLAVVAPPRRRTWGGTRAVVRNRCKSTVFRRFLIDTFGRETLAKGVLDVAGGKGELAFQLVNLNSVPATVVDPRPLHLARFERRAARGAFHRSGPYADYTDAPLEALQADMRPPGHARAFLDGPLVDALASLAAARRRRRQAGAVAAAAVSPDGAGDEDACLRAARRALAASLQRAAAVEWTAKGLVQEHEDEDVASAPRQSSGSCSGSDSGDDGGANDNEKGGSGDASSSGGDSADAAATTAQLDALLDALLSAGCVASMHPDAATEPAVRLALALGVPFAVVPCCVYQKLFPKRRRADGGAVGTHAELVQYLVEITEGAAAAAAGLAPRTAQITELPFEGKNLCVWSASAVEARE